MNTHGFSNRGASRRIFAIMTATLLASGLVACSNSKEDSAFEAVFSAAASEAANSSSSDSHMSRDRAEESSDSQDYGSTFDEPTPSTNSSEPSSTNCGLDTQASEIYAHISEVPTVGLFEGNQWQYGGSSNYDPCADLSYAELYQEGTHASTPSQLMLFHKGEYLGVGSDKLLNPIKILSTTDDSITIRYKDWDALAEANGSFAQSPEYYTDITYLWDGERVQMNGYLPPSARS